MVLLLTADQELGSLSGWNTSLSHSSTGKCAFSICNCLWVFTADPLSTSASLLLCDAKLPFSPFLYTYSLGLMEYIFSVRFDSKWSGPRLNSVTQQFGIMTQITKRAHLGKLPLRSFHLSDISPCQHGLTSLNPLFQPSPGKRHMYLHMFECLTDNACLHLPHYRFESGDSDTTRRTACDSQIQKCTPVT